MSRLSRVVLRRFARRRWATVQAALAATLVLGTSIVAPASRSSAQAAETFHIDVSKTTDLVSGEAIQIEVTTDPGTTFQAGVGQESRVRVCRWKDDGDEYTPEEFGQGDVGGTLCPPEGQSIQLADESVDSRSLYLIPDFTRAITALRPGIGTGHWTTPGPVEHELTCDETHRCRLVFQLNLVVDGQATSRIKEWDALQYRPSVGVAGCSGSSPDVIASTMPDRLLDTWQTWTRDVCQVEDAPPPTSAFFRPEGEGLDVFASGGEDLAYSAVGYRDGFQPATERPMVPVPIGLNAVVVAVGGGYPVENDNSWPNGSAFPKRHSEFRLTNEHIAMLIGQAQYRFLDHFAEVNANNPWMTPGYFYLNNDKASSPLTYGGPQSTALFASTYLDTVVPEQWVNVQGLDRGIETNFDTSEPAHQELAIKSGRPELSKIVYQQLFSEGTYYVLTDLATANTLGLTVASIPDPDQPGAWITPTAETMAAAVPEMLPRDDGTLLPNPAGTGGYPLTYVEYAVAPAEPLVGANCVARAGSQDLLDSWLGYVTSDGQQTLAEPGGLAPLTDDLRTAADQARERVGASPTSCRPDPTTTAPPTSTTGVPGPAAPNDPGARRPSRAAAPSAGASTAAVDAQAATPETRQEALEAAEEADVDLPELLGIRAINDLLPPIALVAIVAMTAVVALASAGYPVPAGLVALGRRVRRLRLPRLRKQTTEQATT